LRTLGSADGMHGEVPQSGALETPAQRQRCEQRGDEGRPCTGRGGEIRAEYRGARGAARKQRGERPSVDENGGRQDVAVRQRHGDGRAHRNRAARSERQLTVR